MAPVVAANGVRVTMSGTVAGRAWANVIHGITTGAGTEVALATDLANAYTENIMPFLAPVVQLTAANFVDLSSLDGASGPVPGWVGPVSGSNTGQAAPPNVCYLGHLYSGGTRTQRNGRIYLPGVLETTVNDGGELTESQQTGCTAVMQDMLEEVAGGDNGEWAVLSKGSLEDYVVRAIAETGCDRLVATQRRRLRS